jgi:hypothetical protein
MNSSLFSYPLLAGDPGDGLKESNRIVLSNLARKIFQVHDNDFGALIGKSLRLTGTPALSGQWNMPGYSLEFPPSIRSADFLQVIVFGWKQLERSRV